MTMNRNLMRSLFALTWIIVSAPVWADDPAAPSETTLLAVLSSDAASADKAIACKQLAIVGSSAAVPELAKLLPDPQLSSWARTALEAIPGEQADAALRSAAEGLDGRLLVGMINSIGVRRDLAAIDVLAKKLQQTDASVASAAAVALGKIGNPAAAAILRAALASASADVRSAIAEGCVLCAERFYDDGNIAEAIKIYDEVRSADVPEQRILEATRGAILARKQQGIPLLLEQLRSPQRARHRLALGIVREFPGAELDQALANELAQSDPQIASSLIHAMADRPQTVVLPAILQAAETGPHQVRIAAIQALQLVGDDSCLGSLMKIATAGDAELAKAAQQTLAAYPGQKVRDKIIALLPDAKGDNYAMLIQLIGQRRIDAVPEVLKGLESSDDSVRHASLVALGEIVPLDQLSVLIGQAVSPKHQGDRLVAVQALRTASVRMPDREACSQKLAAALEGSSPTAKTTLLEVISEVGGASALQILAGAATSGDSQLLDTSSRLLGKWNTVDAAPVLLDLAKHASEDKYKVRALRGYLGLARKFTNGTERAQMCQNAIDAAIRIDEQKLALEVLTLSPSAAGLAVAAKSQQVSGLKPDATNAVLAIAQKLSGPGVNVKELISSAGLAQVDLEIIEAHYGAGEQHQDVTKDLRKLAGDIPLITLPSSSYNESFGGDPTPGIAKQLKIKYRINGKAGEAVFAENALILLPMPQ